MTNAKEYRHGFQGQEEDDEIKGEGNSVNYSFRMHDPRLGRFFAIDPLTQSYPRNSPYAFSENVVINAVELEGLEKIYVYNVYCNEKKGTFKIVRCSKDDYINNDLKVNVNRYNYVYGGAIGKVVFKHESNSSRTFPSLSEVSSKEYCDFFNPAPPPKPEPLPVKNPNAPTFYQKAIAQEMVKGDYMDAAYYILREEEVSWDSKNGAYKFANACSEVGDALSFVPGLNVAGTIIGGFGDVYETALDYHYDDPNADAKLMNRVMGNLTSFALGNLANGNKYIPGAFGKQSEKAQTITDGTIGTIIDSETNKANEKLSEKKVPGQ